MLAVGAATSGTLCLAVLIGRLLALYSTEERK
jgi:hypothetical protein